ncbi:type II secretion system protein M [Ferrovum sp. PN-J185]|uniref:type II secretion system protein GspM n=1 Tax=Ferrovum sp. PN-J185 TaxID=1356306 RepID=UPI00079756EC|nr:type II secretion system protein GspM [Ferrovum sp. PN-J185]KXW56499.1 general secretion pathway, M protein [Ferrovum sp. PN-J185]MCC6068152.1 type II secretion system protein M [Ferrovum sp. PN-J185]MDE1891735.1 type II secretion system protein M [Betaproteobacteria bacterium]MDE2056423.1 type II secretion system protein M [Betaproteobacteria bacterium]
MADQIIERTTRETARLWQGLNDRERNLLVSLFFLLSCLLYYFILIEPAQNGIKQAHKELIEHRQSLANMQSMAKEIGGLHFQQQAILRDPRQIDALIQVIAKQHGLQGITITNISDDKHHRWQLTGKNITFSDWIALLEELHKKTLLEVDVLTATRSVEPGQVNLIAELHG